MKVILGGCMGSLLKSNTSHNKIKVFGIILQVVLLLFNVLSCAWADNSGVWIKIVKHEHLLYVMNGKSVVAKYGVAVGRNSGQKQKSGDCRTPEGNFSVQSIQSAQGWSHDFHDGKGVIPDAYGPWFIRLKTGWSGIGIHGTHDSASIGKNVTEGCIRLKNENLRTLKEKYIKVGMVVIVER